MRRGGDPGEEYGVVFDWVLKPGEEHDWVWGGKRGEDQGMDVGVVILGIPGWQ